MLSIKSVVVHEKKIIGNIINGCTIYGSMLMLEETKLAERQQAILNLIMEYPSITVKQMSETLLASQHTIECDLSLLIGMRILTHVGKDNDGVGRIVDLLSLKLNRVWQH